MPGAAFSIKLRCASWQQLATIYRRDLSRGSMFLKASTQPPIGTLVRIDLELPSASVIELQGTITEHLVDPQRGTGVNLKLEPLPTKSVWMIESALAAENKVRQDSADGPGSGAPSPAPAVTIPTTTLQDGQDVADAEAELVRALEAEVESLRKLNPFLVLGVGYETTDEAVRASFGELTKRYHPDRFVRYQSVKLRQIAAEIFILIRDAYRKLADDKGRQAVIASLGVKVPARAQTQPRYAPGAPVAVPPAVVPPAPRPAVASVPAKVSVPPAKVSVPPIAAVAVPAVPPPALSPHDTPTANPIPQANPYEAPTNASAKPAELAGTELARPDQLAVPQAPLGAAAKKSATTPPAVASDGVDTSHLEALLDEGRFDEAISGYWLLTKKHPSDKGVRAGIELAEGMKALAARDRMEAAQRFEAALEHDPSNERAARELAEMRRQATNERKGLLSRLMGKKEPPP